MSKRYKLRTNNRSQSGLDWRGLRHAVLACSLLTAWPALGQDVPIFDGVQIASVVHDDASGGKTFDLGANLLARDLESLTGRAPATGTSLGQCHATCIVIGLYNSPKIKNLARVGRVDLSGLKGQWETYQRFVVRQKSQTYVVIAGSDRRGTIYGTVDLSRQLGISPWEWWADVTPRRLNRLTIDDKAVVSKSPSVKYRGVFLNDEDWGLQPWASKTLDASSGNIGPKTYARVFELMWRLKANTLWPAMHSVSTPFYGIKDDPRLAADYSIVVGTSHAEPMMRNNLREWDEAKRGPFDFTQNRPAILDYWRQRVDEGKRFDNIYTVGLRGLHDGPMQGASTMTERQAILQNVIGLQRGILSDVYKKPAQAVPQVYVAYHELQEAYDAGLKVPDDITLMWADDNYGYIRRFATPEETKRSGGSGVYYHLSYWGRPHDYLWLGTTHPGLIHEEMSRAWDMQARRMWIANVGDIKPLEFLTQYFLDLAFDTSRFAQSPRDYLTGFMSEQFGPEHAADIADIMMSYYDLAFERRPEFMGFGQTEWVSQNRHSAYVQGDGEEAQKRLAAYASLTKRAEALAAQMPEDRRDAFFELVLYPVRDSAALNTRILSLDLADLYAQQGRAGANIYAGRAKVAHARLEQDAVTFNGLGDGKWKGMMDMAPRRLPVFDEPLWPSWSESKKDGCDTSLSGQWFNDHNTLVFVAGQAQDRPLTLFGYKAKRQTWQTTVQGKGLTLSSPGGDLNSENAYEQRLSLHYDGLAGPGDQTLTVSCGGQTLPIYARILQSLPAGMPAEDNRTVTIAAASGMLGDDWQIVDQLGSQGRVVRARLDLPVRQVNALSGVTPAVYDFTTSTEVGGVMTLTALPTHPLDPGKGVRVAIQLDNAALEVLDFSTLGRSDEWRTNVLTNTAVRKIALKLLPAGHHLLKIYPLDPGVVMDRIEVDLDRAPYHYGPAGEARVRP